jgi:hypothetical protein
MAVAGSGGGGGTRKRKPAAAVAAAGAAGAGSAAGARRPASRAKLTLAPKSDDGDGLPLVSCFLCALCARYAIGHLKLS